MRGGEAEELGLGQEVGTGSPGIMPNTLHRLLIYLNEMLNNASPPHRVLPPNH